MTLIIFKNYFFLLFIQFTYHLFFSYSYQQNYQSKISFSQINNNVKKWFINNAEQKGIPWNNMVNEYKDNYNELLNIQKLIKNQYMYYPNYYVKPFHGYINGNLNWDAAVEAVPATYSISSDYWKLNNPFINHENLRKNYTNNIKKYYNIHNKNISNNCVLDLGCSVGISTEFLKKNIPNCKLTGIDLSSYFLSIAEYRNKKSNLGIKYIHSNAEYLTYHKGLYDLITIQFMFHEMPKTATLNVLKQSYDNLKNNSVIAILDLDNEKLKKKLSFNYFRKYAFDLTEPHIQEYYSTNISQLLIQSGFDFVKKFDNDPYNSVWFGYKSKYSNCLSK